MSDSQTTSSETEQSPSVVRVGDTLRLARERAGLNISDVARALRISQKYLEALEDNRHEDLPGTTYAIGFVRSFAEHLHMDGEEMVRRYKDEAAGITNPNDLSFPKPISEGGVPGGAVLGLGVIVAAIAYGAWYWNSAQNDMDIARVDAVPEHLAADETPDVTAKPVEQTGEAVAAQVDEVAEETAEVAKNGVEDVVEDGADKVEAAAEQMDEEVAHAREEAVEAVEEKVEEVAQAAEDTVEAVAEPVEEVVATTTDQAEQRPEPAAPEAAEAESAAPAEPVEVVNKIEPAPEPVSVTPVERENVGPSRITLRGKSNSWISVRDTVSDRLLFMRLLSKGEEYQVPNRSGLELMTGNAGELELWVDGKLLAPLGHIGEVKRNVELDADKLKATVKAEQ